MKKLITSTLTALLLSGSAFAQISTFPHTTNFESEGLCGTSCTGSCNIAGPWKNGDQYAFAQAGTDWLAEDGSTPSTDTGPDVDHTTGTVTGKYAYVETSGCNLVTAHLVSDIYDFTATSAPRISFWWHMYGATMGTMHLDVDSSGLGNWNLDVVPAWTANVNAWQFSDFSLAGYGGDNNVRIRIRMVTGTSFTSDAAVDDITVYQPAPNDIGVVSVSAGGGCGNSVCTPVFLTYLNAGSDTIDAGTQVPVSFEINSVVVTDTITVAADILPNDTVTYQFVNGCADLSGPSQVSIEAWSAWLPDALAGNDTASAIAVGIPIIATYPYFQDFETGQNGWVINNGSNGTWAFGTPAKTTINSASSGVNSFVTGGLGTGFYVDLENSYVEGPCFDFTDVCDPVIAMDVWWNAEFSWDGMNVTYSTDGGVTWQLAGAFGDPLNWYTDNTIIGVPGGFQEGWSGRASTTNGSGGWVNARHRLTNAGGFSDVKIRINFGTDGSVTDDGVAFDDIHIFNGTDLGVDQTVCSPATVTLNAYHGNNLATYLWSTGATTQTETATATGWYWVDITSSVTCTTRDSIYVLVMDVNSDVDLGPDSSSCAGTIALDAGYWPGSTYLWSDGDTDQWASAAASGAFSVEVTTPCGVIRDTILVTVGNTPMVNLGPDSTFCGWTMLAANAGGDMYAWSTGDTTSSITVSATAVYSVDVTNTTGCTASDTISVTILPVAVVDLGPDSTYCGSVVLTAGAGIDTYLWNTGDTTASITVDSTGVYSVDVTNALGCVTSDTVSITINPLPVIVVSGNNIICNGDSTTLVASGADMYMWVNGPATDSNTVTPTADSTFWVVGTDMISGCSDSASYLVTIYSSPMIAQSVTVCGGDSVVVGSNTYTVSGVYYDTLATTNGCDSVIVTTLNVDNGTVTTQNIGGCPGFQITVGLNTYDTTGTYTDTLVSTFGCDSTVITNLTISNPISVTQTIQGCDTAFSITVGNNTYNTTGTYVDTLVRALGCDSIVTTHLFVTTVFNSTTTVSGFGSIITANNNNANVTYQWMNCADSLQILGAVNQAYYAAFNGSYAVIVTENGCPDTSACVSVVNVGIADPVTNGQLTVFPNPTLDVITVTSDVPTGIVIYNAIGEVVHAQQIQKTATIDLSSYEGGIYFIRTTEGQIVRLVKE